MEGLRFGQLTYRLDGAVWIHSMKTSVVGARYLMRHLRALASEELSAEAIICLGQPIESQWSALATIFRERMDKGLAPLICVSNRGVRQSNASQLWQQTWLEHHHELVWSGFRFVEHEPLMPALMLAGPLHTFALAPRLKFLFRARIGAGLFLRRSGLTLLPYDRVLSPIETLSRVPQDLVRSEVLLLGKQEIVPVGHLGKLYGKAAFEQGRGTIIEIKSRLKSKLSHEIRSRIYPWS